MNNQRLISLVLAGLIAAPSAFAGDSVPLFLPFQGRATDNAGQPIVSPPNLTIKFRIYPAAGACYIYEDTQSVATNGYGFFSVILGGLANRTGPANNFADVFNNDVVVSDSCASTFNGAANEWRRLEVVVDGVALPTMQTIAASAFSINSNMLDGRTSAGYIQVNGAVTQANMATLTGTGDASALHHHDSRYVTLSGNNSISGNITSSGSFYGVGAGSTIGIGTSSPIADFEIRRDSPTILLGATSGNGGTPSITFTSGATQRARIQASETTNEMRFYTGSTEAMRLDASQNLILTGSLQVGGTVGLGKYNNAQEATLITTLTGMGAAAVGTMWVNSQTNTFKFWDGTQAIGLGSASYVTSVTAGTGLSNSGTAQAPVLNVAYGTGAGTAIQGNAVFGGDVTGGYTSLTVTGLQGRPVDATAPTAGQVLTWNTTTSRWAAETIQDTQLSSNVALKNAANVFTNTNSVQVSTATNVGLILQTTDNNTTNSLLSIRNMAGTPIATVRADAVPTAGTDLTTKSYVDTLAGTKLNLSGGTMTGAINMGNQQITNMADPTAAQHAVTKIYADSNLATRTVASTAPGLNQILKWNGSQWEPSTDVDTGITALTGDVSASGSGSVAAVLADSAVTSAKILDSTIATNDIGNLQVTDAKIAGVAVGKIASGAGQYFTYAPNNAACSTNEVLKWNGSAWTCGADNNAGGTVTLISAGGGLLGGNITGTGTLAVNTGTGANQIVQLNGSSQIPAVDGSLLTFINAATLRGVNLSTVAPTSGQVLKYNGSAWEAAADTDTGITALSGDITASGSGSVAATIRNDRVTTAMMRSAGIGVNRILMTDAATGNTVDFADNCSAGEVLKWVDGTNGWACATDVGAGGIVTLVAGGVGTTGGNITQTGTINVDVGTGPNQIVQLNGSSQIPAINGSLLTNVSAATLRGVNLSTTAPTSGYVLKYNGSAWEAAPDNDQGGDITQVQTASPLLGGGSSGGLTLSIDVGTGANQVVQLDGSSRIPAVNGSLLTNVTAAALRGVNLSTTVPTSGQVLKFNGTAWEAAADNNDGGDITSINNGTGILGGAAFGDVTISVDVGTGANQILQLNGSSRIPAVDGSLLTFVNAATLRGVNLSTTAPTSGYVLKYNGSAWEAAPDIDTDSGGDITQVQTTSPLLGGGSAGGLTLSIDVGTGANQVLQLNGSSQIPAVNGSLLTNVSAATLRGVNLSTTAPTSGFVLKYNGSAWEAAADTDTGITALSGDVTASGSGSVAATIRDDRVLSRMLDSTGIGVNRIVMTDAATGNSLTYADTCSAGDVLKWVDGTNGWACASDVGAAGVVSHVGAGTGLLGGNITSTGTLSVNVGTGANQIVQLNGSSQIPAIDGSLLTFVNAASLRGVNLSTTAPTSGYVLKYNGSAWEAAPDNDQGGDITQVQTTSPLLGGGSAGGLTLSIDVGTGANQVLQLNGSSQIPAVNGSLLTNVTAAALRGVNLSTTAPTSGYVLKYNGSAWEAAPDIDTDSGGDITQVQTTSPLLGGGSAGGLTLSIDVGTGANQVLQLNGSSQIPAVNGSLLTNVSAATLRGVNLSTTAPTTGQILTYNGSAWEAAAAPATGVTLVAGGTGTTGGNITGTGTINVDVGTGANQIVQLNGSSQIPAVDGSLLTFINAATLRGVNLSTTAPTSGYVLKYNGSAWEAAPDNDQGGDITQVQTSSPLLGGGSAGGLTLSIDVGTGANQVLQLNGSSQIPAVDGSLLTSVSAASLRGVNLSTTAPTSGYVLKYNGSAWEAAADIDTDTGITALSGDVTASGSGSVAATIRDDRVLSRMLDSTGIGVNRIIMTDAATGNSLTYGDTCSPGEVLKWVDGTNGWACASDVGASGVVSHVGAGTGLLGGNITSTGTLSVNVGTGANQIVQLNGSSQIPAVDGSLLTSINAASLRGVNLSTTAPTSGYVLKYNGSAWEAAPDIDTDSGGDITQVQTTSPLLGGGSAGGLTLSIDVGTGANQVLQLNGSSQIPAVNGSLLTNVSAATLRGVNLSTTAPTTGQILTYNGSAWEAAAAPATGVTLVAGGTGTTGGNITGTGTINVDVGTGANQIVQLNGSSQIPAVDGSLLTSINAASLRGVNLSTTAPTSGYVLKYNGSAWEAAADTDSGGDITQVQTTSPLLGGGSAGGLTLSIDVGTGANQILQLNGSSQIPAVDGSLLTSINAASLRGVNLSTTAPTSGYVLKYNGSAWEAAPDIDTDSGGDITQVQTTSPLLGGGSAGGLTLSIDVGTGANQILQLNGSSQIPAVDGSLLTLVNAATIRGVNVSTTAPTSGQILTYNGSAWEAAAAPATGVTLVAGGTGTTGGNITGTGTINVDVGTGANQIVQLNGSSQIPAVDGSLLTLVNAATIRGVNLSTTAPTSGYVLKYNGSAWEAAPDIDTDSGGDITQVQTTSPLLGGGSAGGLTLSIDVGTGANQILQLNGSSQIPAVDGSLLTLVNAATIRGVNVSTTAPTSGQILTYNGSAWEAAAAPVSGISALSGDVTATGPGSAAATIRDDRVLSRMLDSTGIGVNRIIMTDAATGNSLTYGDTCSPGEVLKWVDGTNGWACATDTGGVTYISAGTGLTGGNVTGTGTFNVDVGTGANQIVQLNGSSQIPAVDGSLLTSVNAAALRGVNLSTTAPTTGQILTYNGSAWEAAAAPSTGVTLVAGGTGTTGGNISGTGTINVDVGTGANQIVQLNGSSQIPAVDGSLLTNVNAASIRGNNVATTAPGSGEVLAWNGSAWAPASLTSGFSGTLPVGNGGTGATSLTDNRLLVGNGTAAVGVLAAGTAGQILQSAGASDPAWSTSTFPSGAAAQYDFLYASAANTWSSFATANTGAMVTSNTGVPSWASGAVANRVLRTDGTTISFAQVDPTNDISQGTGAVTIQSANAGVSTFGNTSGAASTTIRSGTGGTTITSSGTSATAVNITATGSGGGITLTPTPSGLNGHTLISAGRLGIGSASPAYTLDVVGSAQFTSSVHAQAFFYTSDARLKENFTPIQGLDAINRLGGYRFNWRKDHSAEIGLIAQEVEQVFPELVTTNANGYKSVKYGNLVAPLIQSTKELYGMCKANEAQLRAIASVVEQNQKANDARMGALEQQVENLKKENEELRREVEKIKSLLAP